MPVHVLLADSNRALRHSYAARLARRGFHVETAADGLECLDRLRSGRPDILVLDPDLLWGQGDGVLALMHDDENVPRVPVIFLASRYDPGHLAGYTGDILHAYYFKPLEPELLIEGIHRLLRMQALYQASEPALSGAR
jgi:DNA-binding response OmpR family regulator